MDSMRITDVVCMLLYQDGPPPEVTLDMLMRLYDKAHSRYMTAVVMFGVMTMCVFGVLIASAIEWKDGNLTILALVALVFLLVGTMGVSRRLNQLSRDYLDIIKVYNLLGRYMKSERYLYPERLK